MRLGAMLLSTDGMLLYPWFVMPMKSAPTGVVLDLTQKIDLAGTLEGEVLAFTLQTSDVNTLGQVEEQLVWEQMIRRSLWSTFRP
jgi:hypothetical protein